MKIENAILKNSMAALAILLTTQAADAMNCSWIGGAAGHANDWNTAANWAPVGVPGTGDDATIPGACANYPILNAPAANSCKRLTIKKGASMTLAMGGSLAATANGPSVTVDGSLIITGGTLSSFDAIHGSGSVAMSGGLLQVGRAFELAPAGFSASGGTVEWTGSGGNSPAGAFTGSTATYQFFNVLVDAGVNPGFDNQANNSFKVLGNWVNNGIVTLTSVPTSVTFQGSSVQTIGGSISTAFYNLAINNAAGVSMVLSSSVKNVLTLDSGVLATGPNQLNLAIGASVSGASARSYVNGKVQKSFAAGNNQSFAFPIGDATRYAPVSLASLDVTAAGSLSAKTVGCEHPWIMASGINPSRDANRYWTLTNSSAGIQVSSYSATMTFASSDLDTGAQPVNFTVQRFCGNWSSPATGPLTSTCTSATGLAAFGDFAVGEPANSPIANSACTLTSCCQLANQHAMIKLSGVPGLAYTLQASSDLKNWASIGSTTADVNGLGQFEDVDAPGFTSRFYRTVYP